MEGHNAAGEDARLIFTLDLTGLHLQGSRGRENTHNDSPRISIP
jgi:hypothetical protein